MTCYKWCGIVGIYICQFVFDHSFLVEAPLLCLFCFLLRNDLVKLR